MIQPHIICTVTNDLHQDQRMHRICQALVDMGCAVTLVGRLRPTSTVLPERQYSQHRLTVSRDSGPLFYYEFGKKLKQYLIAKKPTAIYAVDTDTLMAAGIAKKRLGCKLIVDMHEYFTEVPELKGKSIKKAIWRSVEKKYVPLADACITVGPALAAIFSKQFGKEFVVVTNVPELRQSVPAIKSSRILYQGVLNRGRGIQEAIDAMELVVDPKLELHIVGGGDLADSLKAYAVAKPYANRIVFHGWKYGHELRQLTRTAWLGLNLLEVDSLSYYYSLANKFFDYMHTGVPSLNMNIPEYAAIVKEHRVAMLLDELTPESIANSINELRADNMQYSAMVSTANKAAELYNWELEKKTLQRLVRQVIDEEI